MRNGDFCRKMRLGITKFNVASCRDRFCHVHLNKKDAGELARQRRPLKPLLPSLIFVHLIPNPCATDVRVETPDLMLLVFQVVRVGRQDDPWCFKPTHDPPKRPEVARGGQTLRF